MRTIEEIEVELVSAKEMLDHAVVDGGMEGMAAKRWCGKIEELEAEMISRIHRELGSARAWWTSASIDGDDSADDFWWARIDELEEKLAEFDPFINFGDVARKRLGQQCQYASRYINGRIDGYPNLGEGLRFTGFADDGEITNYHAMRIHKDDIDEFVRRVEEYRADEYRHKGGTVCDWRSGC